MLQLVARTEEKKREIMPNKIIRARLTARKDNFVKAV